MASMRDRRNYHSTAMLLPDGRVLVAGGGRLPPAADFLTAEIFSPPYLFKGARPTIASAPALMPQSGTVIVETPQALDIASVAMIRLPSVTHTLDMDQRYLPLSFSAEAGRLIVSGPGSPALAPPGYYMLVIVDRQGIPSTASFVRVPSPSEDARASDRAVQPGGQRRRRHGEPQLAARPATTRRSWRTTSTARPSRALLHRARISPAAPAA